MFKKLKQKISEEQAPPRRAAPLQPQGAAEGVRWALCPLWGAGGGRWQVPGTGARRVRRCPGRCAGAEQGNESRFLPFGWSAVVFCRLVLLGVASVGLQCC